MLILSATFIRCHTTSQELAGEGLVRLLVSSGRSDVAMALCSETTASCPSSAWPWRLLADLQLRAAAAAGAGAGGGSGGGQQQLQQDAVASYQHAVRAEPGSAALWEGLAAAYQALGRHTAALKVVVGAHCPPYCPCAVTRTASVTHTAIPSCIILPTPLAQ